ncbi:hypothetical protein ABS315_22410 [Peribacillus frigoritolerans]|uniref:hypothetical protein n=1 Tax=Peribacillus frigoritolerans TaxID=450367 RepID=UPI0034E08DDD
MLSRMKQYKLVHPYFEELIASWESNADLEEIPAEPLKKALGILDGKKSKVAVKVVRELYPKVSEIIVSIPNIHPTGVASQFLSY